MRGSSNRMDDGEHALQSRRAGSPMNNVPVDVPTSPTRQRIEDCSDRYEETPDLLLSTRSPTSNSYLARLSSKCRSVEKTMDETARNGKLAGNSMCCIQERLRMAKLSPVDEYDYS